jgi:energy-coupling factor transporter ATP-binding protein EcfA2
MNLLSHNTKWSEISKSLKLLFIPDIFIWIIDITIKYIVLLGEHSINLLYALKLRAIGITSNKYNSLTGIMGNLFIKSYKASEEMFYAMECRGFVFQNSDAQLFCSTVFEEVAFGLMQMELPEEEINNRVSDCLKILNIDKLKDEHPYNLSGGEKKRVAIASVLAMNPEVITLDEPMNGIDPKGKRFLKELLIALNKSGKTIICATHDFEYIEGAFHRAIVFSEAHKIIRDDKYENIIKDKDFLRKYNII